MLLTGPSRGYVKNRLDKSKIQYRHDMLQDVNSLVDYYNVIDLYIITSREEGGPKALLESLACGVPLVSTKVGMVPDLIVHNENGYLVDLEDEDPSDLGFEKFTKLIQNTHPLTQYKLLEKKLNI